MNNLNIPAIILSALLGILLGALAMPLVREPQLPTSSEPQLPISSEPQLPISGLISAATTVAIGWWIHRAVRRRGELDRIPIDYLSNLNRRIDELISMCLDAATEDGGTERFVNLPRLSNEIYWLSVIAKEVQQPELNQLGDKLASHYVDFKRRLTESDSVDMIWASKASHDVRITALKIQWRICEYILDEKKNTHIFASL